MGIGLGTWGLLVGVAGGVLLVLALLLSGRWGARRSAALSGIGLLLLGLSMSGVVDFIAQATFNPVRWVGFAAAGLGVLLLCSVGMLPGRGRRRRQETERGPGEPRRPEQVEPGRADPARRAAGKGHGGGADVDADMAEIEDILRRRGIQ
jgi:hypothetical protein